MCETTAHYMDQRLDLYCPCTQLSTQDYFGARVAKKIHLVMDNLNIHSKKSLTDAFGSKMGSQVWRRFAIHYTPKHGSWLNQAEIEIGIFARQCLGKRRIPDLQTLRRQCKAWVRRINRAGTKIN